MGKQASKVVAQAQMWLGCNESNGTHKQIIDVYNSHKPLARGYAVKYTDAWCATFVSAVAIKLGYTDIIPTECGCEKMIELFKKIGAWEENDAHVPNPGDVIFYDWQDDGKGDNKGYADHVGYVEKVTNGVITLIEGNYSNAVKRRTLAVNGKNIRGYGVPKYDAEDAIGTDDGFKFQIQINETYNKKNAEATAEKLKAQGFNITIVKCEDKEQTPIIALKEGDLVRMQKDAPVYGKTIKFNDWVYKSALFVRDIAGDRVVVSTKATGPITGTVHKKYLTKI